ERIGPVQVRRIDAGRRGLDDVEVLAAEIVQPARRHAAGRNARRSAVDEVAFPGTRRAGAEVAGVRGGGEVERAAGDHVVDRLDDGSAVGVRDHARRLAVLKRRLHEVRDVVDDDVAAGGSQRADVVGEAGDALERGGEEQLRVWREI